MELFITGLLVRTWDLTKETLAADGCVEIRSLLLLPTGIDCCGNHWQLWQMTDSCDNLWQLWQMTESCDKNHWHLWQSLTAVTITDSCDSHWQLWQSLTAVTITDICDNHWQLWQSLTSVTITDSCDNHWQLWRQFWYIPVVNHCVWCHHCYPAGAKRDSDGYLWVTGRIDDMLNVSGHLLSTAQVESVLIEHPHVAENAVVARPHSIKGECLHCFVTLIEVRSCLVRVGWLYNYWYNMLSADQLR